MIRVIVVDDHPVVRHGLRQIVAEEPGIEVVAEAESARDALPVVRSTPCDVVVLDINLPDGSGLGVLDRLRAERPALPVLVLSIHDEEQYAPRVFQAGAAGYLMKNSIPGELVLAIRWIAAGGRYLSPTLAEKLASGPAAPEAAPHERLSDREFVILCRIAAGVPLKAIGEELFISGKTVSTYRARILAKLGLKSNAELVAYALAQRLLG